MRSWHCAERSSPDRPPLRAGSGHALSAARAWLALAGLLAVGTILAAAAPAQHWDWQPGLALHEPWRALTAAFVHWSGPHLGLNLIGTTAVAALGAAAACGNRATLAWALAWPMTHLALLAQPDLLHYGGLSGVLHAGVAVAATSLVVRQTDRPRVIGVALWAGLALKLLLEAPWETMLRTSPDRDFAIAPMAHASGTLAGLLCSLLVLARRHAATVP